MPPSPGAARLCAYALPALPLAMLSLPLYVHLPKLYHDQFGLDLALLGTILLASRGIDALLDPCIGYWSDRARRDGRTRIRLAALCAPPLAILTWLLLNPPELGNALAPVWLAGISVLLHVCLSLALINLQTHGAEIAPDPESRTRVAAYREGFTLVGVLLGAALPAVLTQAPATTEGGMDALAGLIALLLLVTAVVAVGGAPSGPLLPPADRSAGLSQIIRPLAQEGFGRLALVFLCNGTAAAIPATLVLFFVQDVLLMPAASALFLATYFLAGALGMPVWPMLARRFGKFRTWRGAMLLAVAAFGWAASLGPGDGTAFLVICAMSGLALGGDLALPPSLLADLMARERHHATEGGTFFGWWALLTKLNAALAAGIALPFVTWLGYSPSSAQHPATDSGALILGYTLLPCLFKLLAALLLPRADPLHGPALA